MAQKTGIEWTETTWNPITGCTKITQGCKNCYAEKMAIRLQKMGSARYSNGFKPTLHEDKISEPLKWKKARLIFVNSMSDLFQDDVPDDFILRVFDVMRRASQHTFQILTKRSGRLLELNNKIEWPDNVWMGVSVESQEVSNRISDLAATSAKIKFLSIEPLLGPLPNLALNNIDWVIVGGESGHKARPMKQEWVQEIRNQCLSSNVAFFFKQWGAHGPDGLRRSKKMNGRILDDRTWNEIPTKVTTNAEKRI